jgi:RNA polymerase-binding transcription factor DksA
MLGKQEKSLLINAINIRLNRLQTILERNIEKDEGRDVSLHDETARLDGLNHQSFDETLLAFARQERSQLLDNLHWAQSDEAGICRRCNMAIPIRRLLTVPTTRTCYDCAETD